jgi:hypothetical protein
MNIKVLMEVISELKLGLNILVWKELTVVNAYDVQTPLLNQYQLKIRQK